MRLHRTLPLLPTTGHHVPQQHSSSTASCRSATPIPEYATIHDLTSRPASGFGRIELDADHGSSGPGDNRLLVFMKETRMSEPAADFPYRTALIVGAGAGISAFTGAQSLGARGQGRACRPKSSEKLQPLLSQAKAIAFATDARDPGAVATLFDDANRQLGGIDVVVYNASAARSGAPRGTGPGRRCGRAQA